MTTARHRRLCEDKLDLASDLCQLSHSLWRQGCVLFMYTSPGPSMVPGELMCLLIECMNGWCGKVYGAWESLNSIKLNKFKQEEKDFHMCPHIHPHLRKKWNGLLFGRKHFKMKITVFQHFLSHQVLAALLLPNPFLLALWSPTGHYFIYLIHYWHILYERALSTWSFFFS